MEEVIREGKWTCPACGNTCRGRDVKCKGCGQARDKVAFEYDENAAAVEGEDLAEAAGGADWVCAYCSTSNRAALAKCGQCGAAGGEGEKRVEEDVPPPVAAALAAPESSGFSPTVKWLLGALVAGGLALCALFVGLVIMAGITHEEQLKVTSASWSRHIPIEQLAPVQESGWDVPGGGRVLSSREELHHTDRVPSGTHQVQRSYTEKVQNGTRRVKTGTKNLGNGYFKDTYANEPVYRTVQKTRMETETLYRAVPVFRRKYTYEIDRWTAGRSVDTSGSDTSPKWGDVKLSGPKEREGQRTEEYNVTFQGKGGTYSWKPKAADFERLKLGESFKVEVNGLGNIERLMP